jgi:hypothetical protein
VNKLILSHSSIEDVIISKAFLFNQTLLNELITQFNRKLLTKSELDAILYDRFDVQSHLNHYHESTLRTLAQYGYVSTQIANMQSNVAFAAKNALIDRHLCLDILLNDSREEIAQRAKNVYGKINKYRTKRPQVYELLKRLDLLYYSFQYDHSSKTCELTSRIISNRVSYIEHPVAQIACDKDYSICITISHFRRKSMSDTLFAIMTKVFDVARDSIGTLRLSKKHLTLEQVVQLVDFYYKVIN